MKKSHLTAIIIVIMMIAPFFISPLFSQVPFPGGSNSSPCPTWPCPIPLDGGISLLIAAGVAYGGKKLNENRKNR